MRSEKKVDEKRVQGRFLLRPGTEDTATQRPGAVAYTGSPPQHLILAEHMRPSYETMLDTMDAASGRGVDADRLLLEVIVRHRIMG